MGHLSFRYLLPATLPYKVRVRSVLNWREFYDWVRRGAMAILGLHWNRIQRKKHEIHTRRLALRIFNNFYADNCILVYNIQLFCDLCLV